MAKVQLSAFGEKLRSDYIDWPDDKIGQNIQIFMDMATAGKVKWHKPNQFTGKQDFSLEYTSKIVIGIFEFTRQAVTYKHEDGNYELVHLYKLVGIK